MTCTESAWGAHSRKPVPAGVIVAPMALGSVIMASFVDGTIFPGSGHSHLAGYPPQVTATRFFIARHGDTDFGVHGLMTDEGGVLTDKGVMQVAAMVQGMVDDPLIRIEAVYSSMLERAIESGEVAGRILGLPNIPVDGLEEYAVGDFIGRPYA
ncbi:MAG TPA: hypothetical protein DEH05_02420, partial [Propionibacteriaceae bacterium]|nr:hypothetical protein [Propionibacteriaceae bacterium]